MSNKQETIADITAEMRLGVKDWKGERLGVFDCFADRIEAAAKREREAGAEAAQVCGEIGEMIGREATREESSRVGNAAAIRSALDKLVDFLRWTYAQDYPVSRDKLADAIDIGVSALASPPRNCDVGTAEEQSRRYEELCDRHTCGSRCSATGCPMYEYDCSPFAWSQMPYEEGGSK